MKQSLSILHIEDSEEDSELIKHLLSKEGVKCDIKLVQTRAQVFDALQNESFDLILSDCKLPNFSGMHALEIAHALRPDTPFIFVSGTIGEETAIESLRSGAIDYILKDHLIRLVPAVHRALAEAEEHTLCRQLQHRLREAERLEAVSTLSNGIAHDFNNILTIILGHASLLTLEYDHPERVLELTNTITHAALRASEVVQQLLAFSHKSDDHMVLTDINSHVRTTLDALRQKLPEKTDMVFEPADSLPMILTDNLQLERILINLVANAIDSMPDGGHIALSTSLLPAKKIPGLSPNLASENYVCLKVTDTGIGMAPATRERIFEPFYTTKQRNQGTGLGLPVVYGLMKAHHGLIHVDSAMGKGTAISLFFPVPGEGSQKGLPDAPLSIPKNLNESETIFIVEDEPDVGSFLETVLQSQDYSVLVAHNHEKALDLFKANMEKINLVLSDIGLPKVDGIALCRELKRLKPSLKISLASGYSPQEFKVRMDDLGVEAFVSKPYNTLDILHSVRKALNGRESGKSRPKCAVPKRGP